MEMLETTAFQRSPQAHLVGRTSTPSRHPLFTIYGISNIISLANIIVQIIATLLFSIKTIRYQRSILLNIKEKVLTALEASKGTPISGEALAQSIGVSRTAVWKAVTELKNAGYSIESATKRGYLLSEGSDILSVQGILPYIKEENGSLRELVIYPSLDSTNAEAKRRIAETPPGGSIPFGDVIIAEAQTDGRGRRGKAFYSPGRDSLYVSFILRPAIDMRRTRIITIAAADAICTAIEDFGREVSGGGESSWIAPQIKWVNDIFVGGKKVSGILTEAVSDVESGQIESIVLGVGININLPMSAFPEEIRGIAGSIELSGGMRNRFAAALINHVLSNYEKVLAENTKEIVERYRNRSMVVGKEIEVIDASGDQRATVTGIGDDGSLLVRYADNAEGILLSGEIRILP
jgi:BirA family biotin operon repressor/biotin-[acetyl-CoA-carboxylase] ligase